MASSCHLSSVLCSDVLDRFVSNALLSRDEGDMYEIQADMHVEGGMHARVLSKRFVDAKKHGSLVATFVLARMEEEFWKEDLQWEFMRRLGAGMWHFLLESIPRLEEASCSSGNSVDAILTCEKQCSIVLLLKDGSKVGLIIASV